MLILLLDLERSGGLVQEQILFLAAALERSEFFRPLIGCPADGFLAAAARAAGLDVFPLKAGSPRALGPRLRLWFMQRKEEKLLIHAFGSSAHSLAHIARKMRRPDTGILVQSLFAQTGPDHPLSVEAFALADKITCGSAHILNQAAAAGLEPSRMAVVRPGYDVSPDRVATHGKSEERFVFAAFGALAPGEGHSVLVKAMSALWQRPDLPQWEVRVFGAGPLFNSILEEAMALGVADRLALLGEQEAGRVLPLCDAMLVPGGEAGGHAPALCLGWIYGLPVICADLPVNMELARHERNALAVARDDPQALAAAMIRLMQRGDLRQDLLEGGQGMLPSISGWAMTEAFIKLYSDLVAGRGWVLPPKAANKQPESPAAPEDEPAVGSEGP